MFRDFNFDQDRQAATTVIAMGLPTTLVPYEVARQVMLGDADLGRIDAAGDAAAWVAARARGWLDFWKEDIGREGFYPFDLLAGAYVVEPRLSHCAKAHAWVSQDSRLRNWFYDSKALLVGSERATPVDADAVGAVVYCAQVDPDLRRWLLARLAASDPLAAGLPGKRLAASPL